MKKPRKPIKPKNNVPPPEPFEHVEVTVLKDDATGGYVFLKDETPEQMAQLLARGGDTSEFMKLEPDYLWDDFYSTFSRVYLPISVAELNGIVDQLPATYHDVKLNQSYRSDGYSSEIYFEVKRKLSADEYSSRMAEWDRRFDAYEEAMVQYEKDLALYEAKKSAYKIEELQKKLAKLQQKTANPADGR